MKTKFPIAIACLVAASFAGNANAIPIRFEVSGTTSSGELGVGVFNIETDGMFELTAQSPTRRVFADADSSGMRPIPMTGSLTFGGQTILFGGPPENGFGQFNLEDACTPDCAPNRRDAWAITLEEQSFASGETPAFFWTRSIAFGTRSEPGTDGFDSTGATAQSLLTLPLLDLVGLYYVEEYLDCTGGPAECFVTESVIREFVVDTTVVRSVDARSVPEPGTLGLFGAALMGMWVLRRRTRTPAQLTRD